MDRRVLQISKIDGNTISFKLYLDSTNAPYETSSVKISGMDYSHGNIAEVSSSSIPPYTFYGVDITNRLVDPTTSLRKQFAYVTDIPNNKREMGVYAHGTTHFRLYKTVQENDTLSVSMPGCAFLLNRYRIALETVKFHNNIGSFYYETKLLLSNDNASDKLSSLSGIAFTDYNYNHTLTRISGTTHNVVGSSIGNIVSIFSDRVHMYYDVYGTGAQRWADKNPHYEGIFATSMIPDIYVFIEILSLDRSDIQIALKPSSFSHALPAGCLPWQT